MAIPEGTDGLGREGLRVKMEPVKGITPKDLMPKRGFYFQAPPLEEFVVDYAHAHNDYSTITNGQFSRRSGVQLRTAQFDTLVVDYATWTIIEEPVIIEELSQLLIDICESGEAFRLIVAHSIDADGFDDDSRSMAGPELMMKATLRELTVSEKAGEGDARYLNVAFHEYRQPITLVHAIAGTWPRIVMLYEDGHALDAETLRRFNDPVTLHRLAKAYYHDPSKWRFISGYNKNHINDWGASGDLADYFKKKRNQKSWPVKITIPKPKNG